MRIAVASYSLEGWENVENAFGVDVWVVFPGCEFVLTIQRGDQ